MSDGLQLPLTMIIGLKDRKRMDCYVSYRSPWMRNKVLDYLQNLLMRHQERISDDDIFIPMECSEVENRLSELICKLPKNLIPETRIDSSAFEQLPKNLTFKVDSGNMRQLIEMPLKLRGELGP